MEVLHRIADEFEKRKDDLLVFALLLGFGFFINRGVELKGLYMDDLYLWSCYGEQSFREFVFPIFPGEPCDMDGALQHRFKQYHRLVLV